MFVLADGLLKIKAVGQGRSSVGAERRRICFTVRIFATALGRGWCIDLTEEGLYIARRPQEARSPGTVEVFHTTVWFRASKNGTCQ